MESDSVVGAADRLQEGWLQGPCLATGDTVRVLLGHVRLFAAPVDCGPPGSSVQGILQARILGWVAVPPVGTLPAPGIELGPHIAGRVFTDWTTREG